MLVFVLALGAAAVVDVVAGCAAGWGRDCGCDVGGEFVCAALAVAGGVLMPFVSGAGDAMAGVGRVGGVGGRVGAGLTSRCAGLARLCVGLNLGCGNIFAITWEHVM